MFSFFSQNAALSEEFFDGDVSVFGPGESLTIVSPDYPENYPNHANVQWLVSGPEGYQVVAKFHAFNLESGYDFLSVGSGLDPNNRTSLLVTLSGSDLPEDVVSNNHEMWLNFTSDYSITKDGFWLEIMVFREGNKTMTKFLGKLKYCHGITLNNA